MTDLKTLQFMEFSIGFYCWLSFQSALWGNLLLYAAYYIPMQIIGYFRWNQNLKKDKKEISEFRESHNSTRVV